MIKVLIADDEMLIRVGIKSCIDWESNGFEIAGLAEDGTQALEMVDRLLPEIVLTDIRMPNMDGLELIELIKRRHPEIKVIVLSCYNELDYIKKAIKLGADDYILKLSMQPEALLDVMLKTKDAIAAEKEEVLQSAALRNENRLNQNLIKEDLYRKFLDGSIPADNFITELKSTGSSLAFKSVRVIYAGIDGYLTASVRSKLLDRYLLKFSIINILEEVLSGFCKGDVVEKDKGVYLILMDFDRQGQNPGEAAREYCLKVNNALKNYLNIHVSFGISGFSGDLSNFAQMNLEAEKALEHRFYYDRESIVFYSGDLEFSDKPVLLNLTDEKLLVGSLENLDPESAKGIVDRFFGEIQGQRMYSPVKVRMAAIDLMHSLIKVARKFDIEPEQIAPGYGDNPVDALMRAETLTEISDWFGNMIELLADRLSNRRLSIERPEILKLKQYISERIYEDITLEQAARITNISKSYLSTIFKKVTGEAYTDYVNRLKMEEAKELIQKDGLKIYEAAEKLGFHDESYFSKLFKKYIGINPSRVNSGNRD